MIVGATGPTSPAVAALAAAGAVAVQPIGAVEQHGPHLPVTTDAEIAEALAGGAVQKLRGSVPTWLLPVLSYGLSPEHLGRPGTVSLSTSTLLSVCLDLGRSVAASGVGTLIFVNAHGGNPDLLRVVARDIHADCGVRTYVVHAPELALPRDLVERMPEPALDVHAGFYETSVMLALDAAAVDLPAAAPDGLAVAESLAGLSHVSLFGGIGLPWHTDDLSESGVIGDPSGASAEWGRAALEAQTTALAEAIGELARFEYPR
ncbi:creatininase family protein [Herbiconiux flava]|uniref:Creatinine amidohydrolase n=1 Tax=Herbiconiux flava TaxID=881268 RepID=A0A852SPY9_9MICO|nr:creatininase family protein [Herbiconiux flava]NYD70958.1 creatinine amidohydrolase [Herbiconiux flava]GLK19080.1 creatinine amidohydrolase [Herbiconiux flava]